MTSPAPRPATSANTDSSETAFRPEIYADMAIRAQTDRIPVLMYHDIIARRRRGSVWFDCTKKDFEAQLDWLDAHGAHPISLETLHRHLTRGDAVPENAVVLTFDDNYQGFYDNAYPLLQKRNIPAAMFVHTNYVGDKTGDHPKMSWDTLLKLDHEGVVTIGSHTLSHPPDMRKLSPDEQTKELTESKQVLEQHLGHPVPYLAYPDGNQDATTRQIAKTAGYTMAFTIENGPAEESPDILAVNRTIQTRLEKAWAACQDAKKLAPAAVVLQDIADKPVTLTVVEENGVKLGLVRGGLPASHHSATRESVGEFVKAANAVAGINGTFFADARVAGTDANLIGPCQTTDTGTFEPDNAEDRYARLLNRPMVIWGPKQIAIVPFQPRTMNRPEPFKDLMPDYTDIFLAGGWIVHNGTARPAEEFTAYATADAQDPRRRAFFGFTADGEIVLGATLDVVTTEKMAEAAAAAGVQEAVLLDSGFSTSLIFDGKVIVTGHTDRTLPSRPVPHAIVLQGTASPPTDPETLTAYQQADPAVSTVPKETDLAANPVPRRLHRKRKRKRRHTIHHAAPAGTPGDAAPPTDSPAPTPDPAPAPP